MNLFGEKSDTSDSDDEMPSEREVDELFNNLFNDINKPKDMKHFDCFPTKKKWKMIQMKKLRTLQIKPPQILLKELRENFTIETLFEIETNLRFCEASYCQEFCENKGHLNIFIILGYTQVRIDFQSKQVDDDKIMKLSLACIQHICDIKRTINYVTSHHKSLSTIIGCLKNDKATFDYIINILILFLFENDDDDNRFAVAKQILKYFSALNVDGQNGWEIFVSIIKSNYDDYSFLDNIISFIKSFLLVFSKSSSLFMEMFNQMEKSGLIEILNSRYYFDKIMKKITEQKQMHIHGINMKILSILTVENNEKEKGQLDEIMNQLKNDNFLTTEDPFFDINQLIVEKELGSGAFGNVYSAKCKENSQTYAVKVSKIKVNEETRYSDETLSIFREINLMSSFNFPTILKFIGYSPTNFKGIYYPTIIMEFCPKKTLADIIDLENKGLSPEGWNETKKLISIYGIAAGMKYLHKQNIIHRDLKSQNILMDDLYCPKIADFGLSKITAITEQASSLNIQSSPKTTGTPLYMAPEILAGEPYSQKGDVYAFSIIVYEIITGKTPFKNLIYPQLIIKVFDGQRPELSEDVPDHYRKLIEKCWAQSPSERPTFDNIVNELKNNHSFINDSIDEIYFQDFIHYLDNYQSTFDLYKKHIMFDDFIKGKHGNANLIKTDIEKNDNT